VEEAYRGMKPLNLSKDFMETLAPSRPSRLAVLAVQGITWSDWGSDRRILGAAQPQVA